MSGKAGTEKVSTEHLGTKSIALFMGIVLAFIYTVLKFFTTPVLAITDLYNIGLNTAFYGIVWTLIIFAAQLLTTLAKGFFNKLKTEGVDDLGIGELAMFLGIVLAFIYTILQFFVNATAGIEVLYNIGLVTAFFSIVWVLVILIAVIIWCFAHGLGEKVGLLFKPKPTPA